MKKADVKGKRFGKLIVMDSKHKQTKSGYKYLAWRCICDCGSEKFAKASELTSGYYTSCGKCTYDLTGKTIGVLTITGSFQKDDRVYWNYKCECGYEYHARYTELMKRDSSKCICHIVEKSKLGASFRKTQYSNASETNASINAIYHTYRSGSSRRNLIFDLTPEEAFKLFIDECFYCGAEPSKVSRATSTSPQFLYNGIDRYDNEKGYYMGNVVTCCTICNKAKSIMHGDDFIKWTKKISSRH